MAAAVTAVTTSSTGRERPQLKSPCWNIKGGYLNRKRNSFSSTRGSFYRDRPGCPESTVTFSGATRWPTARFRFGRERRRFRSASRSQGPGHEACDRRRRRRPTSLRPPGVRPRTIVLSVVRELPHPTAQPDRQRETGNRRRLLVHGRQP